MGQHDSPGSRDGRFLTTFLLLAVRMALAGSLLVLQTVTGSRLPSLVTREPPLGEGRHAASHATTAASTTSSSLSSPSWLTDIRVLWTLAGLVLAIPVLLLRVAAMTLGAVVLFAWASALRSTYYCLTGRGHWLAPRPLDPSPLLGARLLLQHHKVRKRYLSLRAKQLLPYHPPAALLPASPRLQAVLRQLVPLITRDFVRMWYEANISTQPTFPAHVEAALYQVVHRWTRRVERVDVVSFLLGRILPLLTRHVADYRKAEKLLKHSRLSHPQGGHVEAGEGSESRPASRAAATPMGQDMDTLRFARFYRDGQLHPAVRIRSGSPFHTSLTEHDYLAPLLQRILLLLLPPGEASSKALLFLLREILTTCLVIPLLGVLAEPDYWNTTIEWLTDLALVGETSLVERIKDTLLRQSSSSLAKGKAPLDDAAYYLNRPLSFEEFITSIKECQSRQEAQALRAIIVGEVERRAAEVAHCGGEEYVNGAKVSQVRVYISQLHVALRRIDKKIASLAKKAYRKRLASAIDMEDITASPHLFAQFTEFLDAKQRLPYLQFYTAASSFFRDAPTLPSPLASDTLRALWRDYLAQDSAYRLRLTSRSLDMYAEVLEGRSEEDLRPLDPELLAKLAGHLEAAWREVDEMLCTVDVPAFFRLLQQETALLPTSAVGRNSSTTDKGSRSRRRRLRGERICREGEADATDPAPPIGEQEGSSDDNTGPDREPGPRKPIASVTLLGRLGSPFKWRDGRIIDPLPPAPPSILIQPPSPPLPGLELGAGKERDPPLRDPSAPEDSLTGPTSPATPVAVHVSAAQVLLTPPAPVAGDGRIGGPGLVRLPLDNPDLLPALLTPTKAISALNADIDRLLQEYGEIVEQLEQGDQGAGDVPPAHQGLNLMRVGVEVELRELLEEKRELELRELRCLISPARTTVAIVDAAVHQEDMRHYVAYLLEVQCTNADGVPSRWLVTRRFSDFHALHATLRAHCPGMGELDFPSKTFNGLLRPRREFVEGRKLGLERYLRAVLQREECCRDPELGRFLCPEGVSRALVAACEPGEGIDARRDGQVGEEGLASRATPGGTASTGTERSRPMLLGSAFLRGLFQVGEPDPEAPSVPGVLGARAGSPASPSGGAGASLLSAFAAGASAGGGAPRRGSRSPRDPLASRDPLPASSSGSSPTEAVIADLFVELFELRERSNWFRKQAVYLLVQQLFGGAVERRVTESLRAAFGHDNMAYALEYFCDRYWPQREAPFGADHLPVRGPPERARSQEQARSRLAALFPELLGNLVGRQNAQRGAFRLWQLFQNPRLNLHLLYGIVEEGVVWLFPELGGGASRSAPC